MQIKIFTVPIFDANKQVENLNKFLRSHKIIDMEKHFFSGGSSTYWTFCIRYLNGENNSNTYKKPKVDYKEVLDEEIFQKFSRFREIRKKIAEEEAIPAYAVFTNEELAEIAKLSEITEKSISGIRGIGAKRIEKYAHYFIM